MWSDNISEIVKDTEEKVHKSARPSWYIKEVGHETASLEIGEVAEYNVRISTKIIDYECKHAVLHTPGKQLSSITDRIKTYNIISSDFLL